MKQAAAGGADGNADASGAETGKPANTGKAAAADDGKTAAAHPFVRARKAREAEAERRKHAGLGDIEHEAARARIEARQAAATEDFAPNDPQGSRLHYSAGPAVEAAREVNRLRRDRPDIWKRRADAVRRKAAAVGAAQSGMGAGAAGGPDGRDRAILLGADDLLRDIAAEGNRRTAADLSRAGFDLLTDLAPIVGDIKAAAEARDFLRRADAAEKTGDAGRAAELRALAGLSLASIVPLARAARAGKKMAARIAALSRSLKGGADADPVIVAIDDRAAATARKGAAETAARTPRNPARFRQTRC